MNHSAPKLREAIMIPVDKFGHLKSCQGSGDPSFTVRGGQTDLKKVLTGNLASQNTKNSRRHLCFLERVREACRGKGIWLGLTPDSVLGQTGQFLSKSPGVVTSRGHACMEH
jgi:hypothetical protein